MQTLLREIHYATRGLIRRPGFSLVAILTLAIGIGACTAVFSIVDGVLLRPLPYADADRIVQLREVNSGGVQIAFAEPNFLDVRARSRALESVAQYQGKLITVTGGSEPVRALTLNVSSDFFRVIGTKPLIGHTFTDDESKGEAGPVAVVSYGFWQRLLGGTADLGARPLNLGDQTFTVVGVLPAGFGFPAEAEIWVPRELTPPETPRSAHNWSVIGRLRTGATLEQVNADIGAIAGQVKQEYGKDVDAVDFVAIPQQEYMVGAVRASLMIIVVAVGFLFAVACANVANLLLAQATARHRELAVRAAMGASRWHLARQFVAENLVLTLVAGSLGALISYWGVQILISLNKAGLPRASEIGVDPRALIFTFGLAVFVALLMGLVPTLRYSAEDLESGLKEGGRGQSLNAGKRMRGLLIVSQMALTMILLMGAGLLARSFQRLLQIDPGFQPESAVAMSLSLPSIEYDEKQYAQLIDAYRQLNEHGVAPDLTPPRNPQEERRKVFDRQLLERLGQLPGVIAVGSSNLLPLSGNGASGTFLIDNNPAKTGYAEYRLVSSGYFKAMSIPLLRGRTFEATDQPDSPHAAVISQSMADKYWPNENPLGQHIQFGNMDGDLRLLHVVGVVGDVRDRGLDSNSRPTVYANALQRPSSSSVSIVVRGQVSPSTFTGAMRQEVRSLNPELPTSFRTLEQVFSSSLDQRRFSLVIFAVFASVALLLAVMGIYSVTTYSVARRTQEIGIRMALGAQVTDVLKLMLKDGLVLTLIGVAVGLFGAFAVTRLMRSLLFGVTPTDAVTFVMVPLALIVVALVACYVPARRATKVDPLEALRYE